MHKTENLLESLAVALGLEPYTEDLLAGRIRGFPVGLDIADPQAEMGLLFQIRHWLPGDAPVIERLLYDQEVSSFRAGGRIEIEFQDGIAWLTFRYFESSEVETIARLLNSILGTLLQAGFIGNPEVCHHCRTKKVLDLRVYGGKVGQVCPECWNDSKQKAMRGDGPAPSFVFMPFGAAIGALLGALLWTGYWVVFTLYVEGRTSAATVVPIVAITIAALIAGIVAGTPVGWMIRLNRRRGAIMAASAAIISGVLAIAGGEILLLAWLIWRWHHVFSLSIAVEILPDYYRSLGHSYVFLALKVVGAMCCVSWAHHISEPKPSKPKF